ncbi:DUF2637 domain-containing protein [Planosporangium sp. 12N6]|uniref:DUF2637 domain-containing protein n=1 Tax=Planosporangium spinosum TaxID=3402278 RepID=UPI003CEBEFAF
MTQARLRRLQWVVRLTLALGVSASVTANVLHAQDNPISQAIAAWPPLALLITVELVSRIPIYHKGLGALRITATTAIAGIAAYVSYLHMVGVVAHYGEIGAVPYLLPLSVDGLIVVASVSLVELSGRRRNSASAEVAAPVVPVPVAVDPTVSAVATVTATAPTAPAPDTTSATPTAVPPTVPASDEQAEGAHDDRRPLTSDTDPTPESAAARDAASHPEADADPDASAETGEDTEADDGNEFDDGADLAADLVPLLPAARAARDELAREGRAVSRDALARRLRRNGTAIRNDRVSELLKVLRREEEAVNGSPAKVPV